MDPIPVSYKDPYWSRLAGLAETKAGIPSGLLVSVVSKGERSDADQVSEAGARTPFQIIPETRRAALEKYGIDAYLSPENAAEVASLLLKESIARNRGDIAAAVAEYHGGTDRSNWGPKTRAYVNRVMGNEMTPSPINVSAGQSTFQRVMAGQKAQEQARESSSIAAVYQAYKSGAMTPEEAREFETDVESGRVMLPRGASLIGRQAAPSSVGAVNPVVLPQAVTNAYMNGQMSDQERADLEADIRAGVVSLPPSTVSQIPTGVVPVPTSQPIVPPLPPGPSVGEKLIGAGEAALATVTGATGGMVGMIGGGAQSIAESVLDGTFGTPQADALVKQAAAKGAQALTYAPRTEEGKKYTEAVNAGLQQLAPIAPLAPQVAAISQASRLAAPTARVIGSATAEKATQVAQSAGQAVNRATAPVVSRIQSAIPSGKGSTSAGMSAPAGTAAGRGGTVGAAGTDPATIRRQAAADLPVPVDLTKGQATRDYAQQHFEQQALKNPELGEPLRQRMVEQHRAVRQSFDEWIDQTGAQATDRPSVGMSVNTALEQQMKIEKGQIRAAYAAAEKAGEMEAPVPMDRLVTFLDESRAAESTAPIVGAARAELLRLGGAVPDSSGGLMGGQIPLKSVEQLRKFINKNVGDDPTNIKYARDLKELIDDMTDGMGGNLYAKARSMRSRYGQRFEDRSVISDLVTTKRGSSDRRVAVEDIGNRIIFQGSADDITFARRILQSSGTEGQQAWRDVQGSVLQHIRDEATKNVARDVSGAEMISPAKLDAAIRALDKDRKLDVIFGKKGSEQLRSVNELAKVMFTSPPGTVNTSNTAGVLLAAMDMALSGTAGMPLPVASGLRMMTKRVKDHKTRARIQDALGK